jgi:hypothetical protein
MEAYLGAFSGTSLDQHERTAAMLAIMGQARWFGTVAAGYAEAARAGGVSVAEVGDREAALFLALVDADAYPHTRAALEAGVMDSDRDPMAFGIVRLLDGIAAYIDRVSAPGSAARPSERIPVPDDPALLADKRVRAAAKGVREAEKALRAAQKNLRQVRRDAAERIARSPAG